MRIHVPHAETSARPKVLLIEDDASFAAYLSERLHQIGYQVEWLGDGLRGLEQIRQDAADLIVIDLALPGLDGISLLEKLKKDGAWPSTPILVLTGRFSSADVERAMVLGVADYMAKPINEVVFFGRVAELTRPGRRSAAPVLF
jgi:two-component system copper resistance phosphate regulon response regulator CusR